MGVVLVSGRGVQRAVRAPMLCHLATQVNEKWRHVEFTVNGYKEMKDTYILGAVDEVMVVLEDSMVVVATISASRFVAGIRCAGPLTASVSRARQRDAERGGWLPCGALRAGHREEVEKTEKQLRLFSDTLDEWLECQKQWLYLEAIFSAADIQRQLPTEAKAFMQVDRQFKDVMRRTKDRPNAMQVRGARTDAGALPLAVPRVANTTRPALLCSPAPDGSFGRWGAPAACLAGPAGGHAAWPAGHLAKVQRDAGAGAEEPGGLPRDQARVLPQVRQGPPPAAPSTSSWGKQHASCDSGACLRHALRAAARAA